MTVEANSRPPIHQRKEAIGFLAFPMRELIREPARQELTVTCDSSLSAFCRAGTQQRSRSMVEIDGGIRMRA